MQPIKKKPVVLDKEKLKKGQLLVVKVPPFFDKEYLYEISGAGGTMVRASLFHSPRVKKHWSIGDLQVYFANGIIRFADDDDIQRLKPSAEFSEKSSLSEAQENSVNDPE